MSLRWYQQAAIDSLFDYFSKHVGNPVIAMPTGTGKSHVIGGFIQHVLQMWPKQRFMVLTHVKELVEQNATKLYEMWPHAPIGIYSAGLNQRDSVTPIVFGGVASVVNKLELFGWRDLIFVDECHLLSPKIDTRYQYVIKHFRAINPALKVIGLSATPFRLGQGMITDLFVDTEGEAHSVFTDIAFTMCDVDGFGKLLAEGWISPLIPKRTRTVLDVSMVGMNNGEFAQGALQSAVDKKEITYAALCEAMELGRDRKCWLTFASGVEHAEHIAEMCNSFGVSSAAVHHKSTKEFRDKAIRAHKSGELKNLVGNNVFTTGFDNPMIDFIPMLRPTMSPGLWVQMLGRGTRPSPETNKQNCLVLDFAGNTKRLGPINDPLIPRKKGPGNGEVPVKICDHCGMYNHAKVRYCGSIPAPSAHGCGNEFAFKVKITRSSATEELLKSDLPIIERFQVDRVTYNEHTKKDTGTKSIRVSYFCNGGFHKFDEWISFEGKGMYLHKSRDWWRQRHHFEPPPTNALALAHANLLKVPRRISVWVNRPLPQVTAYEF